MKERAPGASWATAPVTGFLGMLPLPACLTDASGVILTSNPQWDLAFEVIGGPGAAEAATDLAVQLSRAASGELPANLEVTVRGEDGQPRSFIGTCDQVEVAQAPTARVLCALVEITDIRRREAQLAFMATHDALTGLPNRRLFEDAMVRSLARSRRGEPGALIMLDIDHLKSYNDTLGHPRGDQALINFALLLQTHIRAGDMLARVGGDEFGVILEGTPLSTAADIAERMRAAAAEEAFVAEARSFDLGLSAGVVPFDGTEEVPALVDAADEALYEAKAAGRNRVVVSESRVSRIQEVDSRVIAHVREALSAGRLQVHYQPVVRLLNGSVAYFESLSRLLTEEDEVLMPVSFIAVAERLGLMTRLTRGVFDQVVEALERIGDARISVNLCGSDLLDRSLPDHIEEGLTSRGVDPARLSFEVSELVAASHEEALARWSERFVPLGCHLVLDRFSAGARGLGLVKDYPFAQVKLDVSTLSRLTDEGGGIEYMEAIRRVVEAHGLSVVASRIEDPRILERVRDAGFRYVQGFDIGEPRPAPE